MNLEFEELCPRKELLTDTDKFKKILLLSSANIIRDSEFEKKGLKNKNLMFFLNCINDSVSVFSTLGNRIPYSSLLGKIKNFLEYSDDIKQLSDDKKIPDEKIKYIRDSIKNNHFLDEKMKKHYSQFFNEKDEQSIIEDFKIIYSSLIENNYFENISDNLYELVCSDNYSVENFTRINQFSKEYFALLLDYVGISMYEIRRIIRDTYSDFFARKNPDSFLSLFQKFAESYKKDNEYLMFIKINENFDERLLKSLVSSGNDNFLMLSKGTVIKKIKNYKIKNINVLNRVINALENDGNNYYISGEIIAKDKWQAIKTFNDKMVQPFLGSMLYSGKNVLTEGKYLIVEKRNDKYHIHESDFFDDIYRPLSQDFTDYSELFKRYIIDSNYYDSESSEINKIIDESVQLLPYCENSYSTLTRFTNTWFALETLFRKANDKISKSLTECASYLVADRMLAGYIYVTGIQIKRTYAKFKNMSGKKIENYFLNFKNIKNKDCCFLEWKVKNIEDMIKDYEATFDNNLNDSKEILRNIYFLRNKQFHGTKNAKMELSVGYLYDIIYDTIAYYIDYLDVYRGEEKISSLFNYIKNIRTIKSMLINDNDLSDSDKLMVAYDAIRKI